MSSPTTSGTPTFDPSRLSQGVTIAVATYRRPDALARLLRSLQEMDQPDGGPPPILICDNDPDGSAKEVAESFGRVWPGKLTYVVEPEPGISAARNRLIAEAQSAFVAFIDDDEVADRNWIQELLSVQRKYQADVVAGPVLSIFESDPPTWVKPLGAFMRPRRQTGAAFQVTGAGNLMIRRALMSRFSPLFDPTFGLTGGEDRHFVRRAAQHGAHLVWADSAVAHEFVDPRRLTRRWFLRRTTRIASTAVRSELILAGGLRRRARHLVRGGYRLLTGAATGVFHLAKCDRDASFKGLVRAASGWGGLLGGMGLGVREYRRPREQRCD